MASPTKAIVIVSSGPGLTVSTAGVKPHNTTSRTAANAKKTPDR